MTAFVILLKGDSNRWNEEIENTIEEIYKSFGVSFIKHVIFIFNRLSVKKHMLKTYKIKDKKRIVGSILFELD